MNPIVSNPVFIDYSHTLWIPSKLSKRIYHVLNLNSTKDIPQSENFTEDELKTILIRPGFIQIIDTQV